MVNRKLKQIAALLIAIAFVGSIIFFIPQVPNSTPLSFEILAPNNLIKMNSSFYSFSPVKFSNVNVSILGGPLAQEPISNVLTSTNSTDLLELTNFILSNSNFSYIESNGRLICVKSKQLLVNLCNNATFSWELFSLTGSNSALPYSGIGSISPGNVSLSAIKLSSLLESTSFILIYYNGQGNVNTNNSGIPKFPG